MKSVYADRPPQLKTASSDMIKLAEAQLFQTRTDDARKETEGLNHIVQAKSKKIDDEFTSLVMKLHLSEAEEIKRQKLEELKNIRKFASGIFQYEGADGKRD
uniref:Oberon coiled-coil region domain-containing protein n=1 Tax=Tanacetum cinerariifolium TaxID=118510 RepID=A0A6L2NFG7_TANCI|nr:hypothetical protein [Tanacetum cinerariifolium]